MRLLNDLESMLGKEESLFRAQLLREDLARLRKLRELARSSSDAAAFKAAGKRLGWTQGDMRTHELREPLERFLGEVYEFERGDSTTDREDRIAAAWQALHRCRMERLVGCLSTPVPKPTD